MAEQTASSLALDAYFDEGDARFLAEVLRSSQAKALGGLAQRWYKDPRPQMRRMLLDYIDDGCERPNHQPLVKRLYKIAEDAKDQEALSHFLVAFDRLIHRQLKTKNSWDWQTREMRSEQIIILNPAIPRGRAPTAKMKPVSGRAPDPPTIQRRDPYTGRMKSQKLEHLAMFTLRTRRYLQRRVWRYFRILGKTNPRVYFDAIVTALQLYRDEHLSESIQLLDAWSLIHALYHHSPVLEQERGGWTVRPGESLANLKPAPIFPELWKESTAPLFELLVRARARTVRLFAIDVLKTHHGPRLERIDFADLRRVLLSPHEEVQVFAAELLRTARGIELLPVDEWMKMLRAANPIALPILCELFEKNVHPDRLSTDACVELARSAAAPVAKLGFSWLKSRPVASAVDIARLLKLTSAEADTVRGEAIDWLVGVLRASPFTRAADVRELVDARYADVRGKGLAWLFSDPRFSDEVLLWGAMCETPYDDVRAALLAHLETVKDRVDAGALRQVWASVLLAIHRGSRAKAHAARQVAERAAANPAEADRLLPLLAISMRSLRAPERRSALAAIGRAAYHALELRASIARHLPGITLFSEKLWVPVREREARRLAEGETKTTAGGASS